MSSGAHTEGGASSCEHAERCGGCPLIDLDYEAQLEAKASRVALALDAFQGLSRLARPRVEEAEPRFGYRRRAKLVVGEDRAVGLFDRRGLHEVIDGPRCRVLRPALLDATNGVRSLLRALPTESVIARALRAIDVREVETSEGPQILLCLVLEDQSRVDLEERSALWERLRVEVPALAGLAFASHDARAPRVLGGVPEVFAGPDSLVEIGHDGTSTRVSHGSFVQAHEGQAAQIRAALIEAIQGEGRPRVLELFAGSGSFGLALAERGCEVTSVESFAPAVEEMRRSARERGLSLEAIAGDATRATQAMTQAGRTFDVVCVNPPRRGLDPALRVAIAALRPARVSYVSCEPATLARDLDHLAREGLGVAGLRAYDMIPQSAEVECLALLEPRAPAKVEVIQIAEDLFAVEKPPFIEAATLLADLGEGGLSAVSAPAGDESGWILASVDPARAEVIESISLLMGVKGVPRARGTLSPRAGSKPVARYERVERVGRHALLRVEVDHGRTAILPKLLFGIGHPILGHRARGHAPTNRFMDATFGLDRPFVHHIGAHFMRGGPAEKATLRALALADDLALVRRRMGAHSP